MPVDRATSTAPVSLKAEPKKPAGKKELDEITIRPANNGFTVKERYRHAGSEAYMSSYPPVESVFESAGAMIEHIEKCAGGGDKKSTGRVDKNEGTVVGRSA